MKKLPAETNKPEVLGFREFTFNSSNPFMETVIEKATLKQKRSFMGIKPINYLEGDEVVSGEFMLRGEEEVVDATTFRKIYLKSIHEFFGYSKTAEKVLRYFMVAMKRNSDVVEFRFDKCSQITGLKSRTSILNGITELLNASVIAKGNSSNRYFINPAIMFNGSRLAIIKQYRREKENGTKQIEKPEPE